MMTERAVCVSTVLVEPAVGFVDATVLHDLFIEDCGSIPQFLMCKALTVIQDFSINRYKVAARLVVIVASV